MTLQDVVVDTPRKSKKAKTIHHLTKSESRELMTNIATLMIRKEGEEQTPTGYQVSQVNLGRQT